MDVLFVATPYHAVERPSLALGLLKAQLAAAGVDARVENTQLRFAERLGLDRYLSLEATFSGNQIGELSFSAAAFRDEAPDPAPKIREIARSLAGAMGGWVRAALPKLFYAARGAATEFVDSVARDIVAQAPRAVGCSSTFEQHVASLAVLRRVKELDPTIVTLMGGPNCEGPMGQATVDAFRWVDHVVSGEADHLIVQLWELIERHGTAIPPDLLPYGVLRRRGGLALSVQGAQTPRVIVHEMDTVAIPDFDDYFEQLAASPIADRVEPGLVVETSRGCWYGQKHHCTFCGQNGMGLVYRAKSPERAKAEFRYLADRHDCPNFGVVDNILDHRYFKEVFPELAQDEHDYRIFYEVKSTLKRHHVRALANAGVRSFLPGIETLDDELCDLMTKGNDSYRNVALLKWAREMGVYVHWILLMNIPGESAEPYARMAEMLPKITHLQPPNSTTPVQFHRFSPYVERADDFGLQLEPLDAYAYVYPLKGRLRRDLAYYFENSSDRTWSTPSAAHGAFSRALAEWTRAFNNGACLEWRDDAVFDGRVPEAPKTVHVDPLAQSIAALMDGVISEASLLRSADALGLAEARVRGVLEELEHHGFALRKGAKWLGLVTPRCEPVTWMSFKAPHGVVLPPTEPAEKSA